jgi:hypothetical protein
MKALQNGKLMICGKFSTKTTQNYSSVTVISSFELRIGHGAFNGESDP